MKLGDKIKELRLKKGLTQASLAGEHMTRSMLCEIEKGNANPSLQTLRYLSEELKVPLSYLIDDGESLDACIKREAMPRLYSLYREKKFNECYREAEALPITPDDELAFLLASSALECGKLAFFSGNMETAAVFFGEAVAYTQKTCYPTEGIRAAATLYAAISDNVCAPRRHFDEKTYRALASAAAEEELYAYLTDQHDYAFKNPLYAAHQNARILLKERKYSAALSELKHLEENKNDKNASAYFLFRLYSELETCYREMGHYEEAYKYASKRMTLLGAFQS